MAGSWMRIRSPGRTFPPVTTTLITPALRTSSPAELFVITSFSSPDWKVLICWHGFRRPVIRTTAWSPICSKVPRGEGKQVDPVGGDVFAELSRVDVEPVLADLGEQFGLDEVDLPQVWLRGVCSDP